VFRSIRRLCSGYRNARGMMTVMLLTGLFGCTDNDAESGVGTTGDGAETLVFVAIGAETFVDDVPSGILYIQVNDEPGNRETALRHIDRAGVAWQQALRAPASWFEFGRRYTGQDDHHFVVRDESLFTLHVGHEAIKCRESCRLTVWYTEQMLNGTEPSDVFWEMSPQLWRRGEFEYRAADALAGTTIDSYDDETGHAVLGVSTVTVDTSGEQLSIELQSHAWPVVDLRHPAISGTPPRNDAAERDFPSLMDAGTTAE
jgi:hypothetical protein